MDYEIKPEGSPFGPRYIVYEDGKRRANCPSEKRAKEFIEELKAKASPPQDTGER